MSPRLQKTLLVGCMFAVSLILFYISDLVHQHHFQVGIAAIDWIFDGPALADLAGSFFVIPVVYVALESVIDDQFKDEIRRELRGFVAEPDSIIPHIDATRLDKFTSTLLNKLFSNNELSDAFVKSINIHKSRYSKPIYDHRVRLKLSTFSDEYFKIDAIISTNKRNNDSRNVSMACSMVKNLESHLFHMDVFDDRFDFVWNFVPYSTKSDLAESNFVMTNARIDGKELSISRVETSDQVIYRSEDASLDVSDSSVVDIEFSCLQRRSLAGISFGLSRPVKSLTVEINYTELDVDTVNVWSYIVGGGLIEPSIRHSKIERNICIRYDRWLMIGSGLVFSWIYK